MKKTRRFWKPSRFLALVLAMLMVFANVGDALATTIEAVVTPVEAPAEPDTAGDEIAPVEPAAPTEEDTQDPATPEPSDSTPASPEEETSSEPTNEPEETEPSEDAQDAEKSEDLTDETDEADKEEDLTPSEPAKGDEAAEGEPQDGEPVESGPSTEEGEDEVSEYTLTVSHVLDTENLGEIRSEKTYTLSAEEVANGFELTSLAMERTGMRLVTSSTALTAESFDENHNGLATLNYVVADGYMVIADGGTVFKGEIQDVTFVEGVTVPVSVNVYITYGQENETKISVYNETAGAVVPKGGSGDFTYSLADTPYSDQAIREITSTPEGTFKVEGNTITGTVSNDGTTYSVDIYLAVATLSYTVQHQYGDKVETETLYGIQGAMTEAKPKEFDHYIAPETVENVTLDKPDIVIEIQYEPMTYHVTYDTNGGSYVPAKDGKYGTEVEIWSGDPGKTCPLEEHTHIPASGEARWNAGQTRGCYTSQYVPSGFLGMEGSWQWVLTCGKEGHTHSAACQVASTLDPATTRPGYTFDGWYLDEACTQPAPNQKQLEKDVTVYAKWTSDGTTVSYTIVYMKEQYNEAGNATEDVFYDSTTGHAQVDSTVTATGLRNRPSNYYDNGTAGPSAVVKADGSTVVYYYYKLKEYTYTFNINNSQATLNKGGHSYTGSQYVLHVKLG